MIAPIINSERAVAKIFNSAIAAAAIGAAWEVGLLDAIVASQAAIHVHNFAVKHDLDADSVEGVVSALAVADIVERDRDAGTVSAGQLLDEAYKMKSLFHWLALGSGGLFSRM
jgi:phenylpyruvate C(3)-methyltransferase